MLGGIFYKGLHFETWIRYNESMNAIEDKPNEYEDFYMLTFPEQEELEGPFTGNQLVNMAQVLYIAHTATTKEKDVVDSLLTPDSIGLAIVYLTSLGYTVNQKLKLWWDYE